MFTHFTRQLAHCECCPRRCGVNRLEGQLGTCRSGAGLGVAHMGLHFGEEPPITGVRGSGAIFFTGCNLRCVFCQNHQISQGPRPADAQVYTPEELADGLLRLQAEGAHNINFVSPSHMVYPMADAIRAARAKGLAIPVVYNSNGYDSVDALRRIRGLVDIYLPDLKYLEPDIALAYSAAGDYAEVVPGVLREMLDQVGHLQVDGAGIAVRGLLVRHLVLPDHISNSRRCLDLLADLSTETHISIMSQYSPQHKAARHARINRVLSVREYEQIVATPSSWGWRTPSSRSWRAGSSTCRTSTWSSLSILLPPARGLRCPGPRRVMRTAGNDGREFRVYPLPIIRCSCPVMHPRERFHPATPCV
jgi:putative pyruvate formate lyase activating enzyme